MQLGTALNLPNPRINFGGTGKVPGKGSTAIFSFETGVLDPRINFTRTTNATVTNSAGVITYAPHNLLLASEQFDSTSWSKSNLNAFGSGSTANNTTAPDGTITADKITPSATSAPSLTGAITNATPLSTYTSSVYVKAAGVGFAYLQMNGVTGTTVASFVSIDLSNGTLGTITALAGGGLTNASATSTSVANGFYRITLTGTIGAGNTTVTVSVGITDAQNTRTGTISTTNGIYAWGAQLEIGSTATTYNSTTVKNLLGYSELFDNAAWTKSNSFVQTNLLTFSEAFDSAAWAKTSITVSANSELAPNGYQTADTLSATAGTALIQTISTAVIGVAYTVSFWVKRKTGTGSIFLRSVEATNNTIAVTNEWQRFSVTTTATSTVLRASIVINTSGDEVYVWGAQAVQGSVAGDYRRTDAAALPVYYPNHNGVVCAEKLVENTANNFHYIISPLSSVVVGTTYTESIYLKYAGKQYVLVRFWATGATQYYIVKVDLLTGTIVGSPSISGTTNNSYSITPVGDGWYRISLTCAFTSGATGADLRVFFEDNSGNVTYTGDGTSGIYIFGAQLSDSASLDPYVLNAAAAPTAAAYYGARFDYDPVTLAPKGLLIEEQRANLYLQSGFAGAVAGTPGTAPTSWAFTLSGGTTNAIVTDGVGGNILSYSTSAARHFVAQTTAILASTTYVASVYINSNSGVVYQSIFSISSVPAGATVTYFANGVSVTVGTYIPLAGDRLTAVIVNSTTAGNVVTRLGIGCSANDTGTVSFSKPQLEAGAFATSYIPTAASQVTRAADIATVQGSNFYSWYNQNEGSVYANAVSYGVSSAGADTFWSVNDGTLNNRIRFNSNLGVYDGFANTVSQFGINNPYSFGSYAKVASAYKVNSFNSALNNVLGTEDTSGITPIVTQMQIGNMITQRELSGHIKQISYYPQRLSNDVLKGLTA